MAQRDLMDEARTHQALVAADDFTRTAKALAEFDTEVAAAWAKLFAMPVEELTNGHVYQIANLERRFGRAVGHAFGLDTADRNALDTSPLPTLTRCV